MKELFVTGRWYHYARLPEHEKKMYMTIFRALQQRCTDFTFPTEKHNGVFPTRERMEQLLHHVLWDNPVLYYVDATNVSLYCASFPKGTARFEFTEYYPPDLRPHMERALRMRVDELLDLIHDYAEGYPRLYALYRRMQQDIRYMYDISRVNSMKNLEARTVVGPLLNHLGVCSGNAKAFKLLCDQVGVGCFYVQGQGLGANGWGNHAWNVVYLEGAFYHVDLTFELEYAKQKKGTSLKYFLVGDADMEADHRWDRSRFPVMPESYL